MFDKRTLLFDCSYGMGAGIWIFVSEIVGLEKSNTSLLAMTMLIGNGFFSFEPYRIYQLLYHFVPFWGLEIIYGMCIYRHFCTAGVYYIGRCVDRKRWFCSEILLTIVRCLFVLIGCFGIILILGAASGINMRANFVSILLLLDLFLVTYLYFLFFVLLINIISIYKGNLLAVIIGIGIQIIMVLTLLTIGPFVEETSNKLIRIIIVFNPMVNAILGLHSSSVHEIDNLINRYGLIWDLKYSVIYWLAITVLISYAGIKICKSYEFLKRGWINN